MTEYTDELLSDRFGVFTHNRDDADWSDVVRRAGRARRGHRRRIVVLIAVAALLAVSAASAAYILTRSPTPGAGRVTQPSGSSPGTASALVLGGAVQQLKAILTRYGYAELAFAPTRAPAHYVCCGGGGGYKSMGLILTDGRFRGSLEEMGTHSLTFESKLWEGTASDCDAGGTDTVRVDGVDVHLDGTTAWRCVVLPSGRVARLSATSEMDVPVIDRSSGATVIQGSRRMSSHLSKEVLADVVASARPF